MFSKKEAQQLKTEFWTVFGKAFPRKWLLYDTKIKDFNFKFFADNRQATVSLNLEMSDPDIRAAYIEKLENLENIITEQLPDAVLQREIFLDNGKQITRLVCTLPDVSIYRKEDWRTIFEFFVNRMTAMEEFFHDFEDYLKG